MEKQNVQIDQPLKPRIEIVKRSNCVHIELHFPGGDRFKITNVYGTEEITVNFHDSSLVILPSVSNEVKIKPNK